MDYSYLQLADITHASFIAINTKQIICFVTEKKMHPWSVTKGLPASQLEGALPSSAFSFLGPFSMAVPV